jgi:RNA polymerase sigma-70 factor (ECF subfamily)
MKSWNGIVIRYGPTVFAWCLAKTDQETIARDVTKEILLNLIINIRQFVYDPTKSFRGWLRIVTKRALVDYFRNASTPPLISADEGAMNELVENLKLDFDIELIENAKLRVKSRTDESHWEVFDLVKIRRYPPADVAAQFGKSVAAVYMIVSQVKAALNKEIKNLEDGKSDFGTVAT